MRWRMSAFGGKADSDLGQAIALPSLFASLSPLTGRRNGAYMEITSNSLETNDLRRTPSPPCPIDLQGFSGVFDVQSINGVYQQ